MHSGCFCMQCACRLLTAVCAGCVGLRCLAGCCSMRGQTCCGQQGSSRRQLVAVSVPSASARCVMHVPCISHLTLTNTKAAKEAVHRTVHTKAITLHTTAATLGGKKAERDGHQLQGAQQYLPKPPCVDRRSKGLGGRYIKHHKGTYVHPLSHSAPTSGAHQNCEPAHSATAAAAVMVHRGPGHCAAGGHPSDPAARSIRTSCIKQQLIARTGAPPQASQQATAVPHKHVRCFQTNKHSNSCRLPTLRETSGAAFSAACIVSSRYLSTHTYHSALRRCSGHCCRFRTLPIALFPGLSVGGPGQRPRSSRWRRPPDHHVVVPVFLTSCMSPFWPGSMRVVVVGEVCSTGRPACMAAWRCASRLLQSCCWRCCSHSSREVAMDS